MEKIINKTKENNEESLFSILAKIAVLVPIFFAFAVWLANFIILKLRILYLSNHWFTGIAIVLLPYALFFISILIFSESKNSDNNELKERMLLKIIFWFIFKFAISILGGAFFIVSIYLFFLNDKIADPQGQCDLYHGCP
jgi:hypothetical protein